MRPACLSISPISNNTKGRRLSRTRMFPEIDWFASSSGFQSIFSWSSTTITYLGGRVSTYSYSATSMSSLLVPGMMYRWTGPSSEAGISSALATVGGVWPSSAPPEILKYFPMKLTSSQSSSASVMSPVCRARLGFKIP